MEANVIYEANQTRICKDCEAFELPATQIESFLRKGLDIPKRCTGCRRYRKQRAETRA